jgi:S1-C subfamily serine protease
MPVRLSFEHLSGARRGEQDVVHGFPAILGSDPQSAVVVPEAAPRHALVVQSGGDVLLRDAGAPQGTYLAGEIVREAVLRDGDVVELGSGGPRLRVRQQGEAHAPQLPVSRSTRPVAFRVVLAVLLLAATALIAWNVGLNRQVGRLDLAMRLADAERQLLAERVEQERRRAEANGQALAARVEGSQREEQLLRARLAEATGSEVRALREELTRARERLATIDGERGVAERIIRDYGAGVCLIHGSYAFFDAAGRPLRVRLDEDGRPARDPDGSQQLQVEGAGPLHTVDYFGTGFLVDSRGLLLTNRHVAEPWWNDDDAQALAQRGFQPRFQSFRAFFPRQREPFRLELVRRSETVDLAVLKIDRKSQSIPAIPLDVGGKGAVPGQPVVVVGYPAGLEAILAKADGNVVREILQAQGSSPERVTDALSRRGLIRPSTTQGHIGDVTRSDIVFDAPTTQGGSGGPVFNRNGLVVAVEYAVLSRFGGNSFGLPVRYALELLKEPRK